MISIMLIIVFGVIVVILFVVGGIGIMNIMLVFVSEWMREIGIRKVFGVKKWVILL